MVSRTAQLAQSVQALSRNERAEMCWQGRQEIRADMVEEDGFEEVVEVTDVVREDFSLHFSLDVDGLRLRSTSSHQSSSSHLVMPQEANHFFRPSGTMKCALGWRLLISVMVGCERWS